MFIPPVDCVGIICHIFAAPLGYFAKFTHNMMLFRISPVATPIVIVEYDVIKWNIFNHNLL